MKITIFGATGRTGIHALKYALECGFTVNAFVRDPSRITINHPNLQIIKGNIFDSEDLAKAISGSKAVVSALGPTRGPEKTDNFMQTSVKSIINAMNTFDVSRIVVTTGAGVEFPEDNPKLFNKFMSFLLKVMAKGVYEDSKKFSHQITDSNLQWTIVRVPRLTDGIANKIVKEGWVGINTGSSIQRKDVGKFLVDQVQSDKYLKKAPVISN